MNSMSAMFFFELKRLVTPARSFWWLCIAIFPVCIILLFQAVISPRFDRLEREVAASEQVAGDSNVEERESEQALARQAEVAKQFDLRLEFMLTGALYFLGPCIACMLGALLTASPAIASELEQHSWIYFATRPNGLRHLIFGKYLVAVVWAGSCALVGVWLALAVANIEAKMQLGLILTAVTLLSAMAYSALYMMIGTLFYRRAMVFCVGYTAAIEGFMGFIPAVVNKLTIQYRLRSLMYQGMDPPDVMKDAEFERLFVTGESPMMSVFWLFALTAMFLSIALTSVQVREFTGAAETEGT